MEAWASVVTIQPSRGQNGGGQRDGADYFAGVVSVDSIELCDQTKLNEENCSCEETYEDDSCCSEEEDSEVCY